MRRIAVTVRSAMPPRAQLRRSYRTRALFVAFEAVVLVGASTVPAWAQQQTAAATTPLVFDGVTVVDVEQGKLVANQRVVIERTRFQAVGSAAKVKIPVGARVV